MDLLHVSEWQVILGELALVDNELYGSIELDSSTKSLLVSLEYLVHNHLQLVDSLFLAELHVISVLLSRIHNESINLLVGSFDCHLLG